MINIIIYIYSKLIIYDISVYYILSEIIYLKLIIMSNFIGHRPNSVISPVNSQALMQFRQLNVTSSMVPIKQQIRMQTCKRVFTLNVIIIII